MSTHNDVEHLRHKIDASMRALGRIRAHVGDLHDLGWCAHTGEALEGDSPGFESAPPRAGDPRARRLFADLVAGLTVMESNLVGHTRVMLALFTARAPRPDPSRGSTIRLEDFDAQVARQRRRADTPIRLEPQPPHPGRRP